MASVYIETSIPSYYFETRRTVQARAWREATREWWDRHSAGYELVTSAFVLRELERGPAAKAREALALLSAVRLLEDRPEARQAAQFYIDQRLMPRDALGDAAHLAMASVHGMDFLLTWNCRHLANANKVPHLLALNGRLGLPAPTLTTPFQLIPESEP